MNSSDLKEVMSNLIMLKNKKGQLSGKIAGLIGALIFIVLAVALAPTMFNGINASMGGPTWLITVLPVIIASGIVFGVWRAFR